MTFVGKAPAEQVIKDVRRATRKQYSAEEKIRIVLEGLRGEESIAKHHATPMHKERPEAWPRARLLPVATP